MIVYIGDLHLGNIYSDTKSFFELLEKIKQKKGKIDEIVLLGDVIDGLDKYSTQDYKQYPETMNIQYNMLKFLLYYLKKEFQKSKIVIVLGNHERYFIGTLFDKELIENKFKNVKIVDKYIDSNKMLNIHQLTKSSGGVTGWSPSLVNAAKSVLVSENKKLRGVVTAHIHKNFSIVEQNQQLFVVLPAFLMSERELAQNVLCNPSLLLMKVANEKYKVEIYRKNFNDIEEVKNFNDRLVTCIRKDYKKCVELVKNEINGEPLKIINKNKKICYKYSTKTRCFTKSQVKKVEKLAKQNLTREEIAKKTGISLVKVYAILNYIKRVR